MTCRANHRHNAIIAKVAKARTVNSVAGFLFWNLPIGRRPHIDVATPNAPTGVASAPPSEPSIAYTIGRHARTCRLAARIVTAARGPQRDKVRAPNDLRLHRDHAARFFFGERLMTAYLISLALVGLVVIAVSEEFS